MKPITESFIAYPSVVCSEKETEITIVARENAYMLLDGEEYTLKIFPIDEDADSYAYPPASGTTMTVTAKDGVLRFNYFFKGEQEYNIALSKDGVHMQMLVLFCVKEDLYNLRPLKGDLHVHSRRSDGKRDPAAVAGYFRENGYDFLFLTDHNRYYPSKEAQDAYKDVELGIAILNGEEIHAPESVVHMVHVGGTESVADIYVHDNERYERELAELEAEIPADVPEKYRYRYVRAMWASREVHRVGGLLIYPHPYWRMGSKTHNSCNELRVLLQKSGLFDAYELIGGMTVMGNNMSVAAWQELRVEGYNINVVGSSDVHEMDDSFGGHFSVVFAKGNDRESILEAVKNGLSVAVEAGGDGKVRQYRCYGSLRLVTYVQFLLRNYFNKTCQIAEGEGVAMRRYLVGEEDGALLSAMAGRVDRFYGQFFGRIAAPVPSKERQAFEAKWREVHAQGPLTKGSFIKLYDDKHNIRQD